MSDKILVLNILDHDVSFFIKRLQAIFNDKPMSSHPHITIRGPYKSAPSKQISHKIRNFIKNSKILLSGAGIFNNDDMYFVYLKATSDNLEDISWKKDFPKSQFDFNPHVTIYKGKNEKHAIKVFSFLKEMNAQIVCKNLEEEFYNLGRQKNLDFYANDDYFHLDTSLSGYLLSAEKLAKNL